MSGTLKKDRTGFSFTSNGVNAYDSKTLNAALPEQNVAGSVRRPADRANFSARVDHALTKSHTLRASYQRNGTSSRNLGVGDFDLPARAYSRDTTEDVFRLSQSGPVGAELLQRDALPGAPPDERVVFAHRCADAAGPRRVHVGRRADRGRAPRHRHRARDRSRLRQGPALGSRRASCSRPAAIAATTPATWAGRSRSPASTRYEAGRPTTFTQRSGESARRVLARAVRRLHAGRHARRAKPVDERRSSLRGPDAHRRLPELRAALRDHVVAVQERNDDDPWRRRHLLRLVRLRSSTSRRCASTAPGRPTSSSRTRASRTRSSAAMSSCFRRAGICRPPT